MASWVDRQPGLYLPSGGTGRRVTGGRRLRLLRAVLAHRRLLRGLARDTVPLHLQRGVRFTLGGDVSESRCSTCQRGIV
jgi:hypothetical protein